MKNVPLAKAGVGAFQSLRRLVKAVLFVAIGYALFFAMQSRFVEAARRSKAPVAPSSVVAPIFIPPNRLIPDEPTNGEAFGAAMAISGDILVVGAPRADIRVGGETLFVEQGVAYVFVRDDSRWTQQAKLLADDGQPLEAFGHSVAISGDTLVVGTRIDTRGEPHDVQGAVYVFTREGTTWSQQAKLTASDQAAEDYFGTAVAINGETIAIGADGDDLGQNPNQGSVYIFTRQGTTWTERVKIAAQDGARNDNFGSSLAMSGSTLIVGAKSDDVGDNTNQGSAYTFTGSDAVWSQQTKLTAADGASSDEFGVATAIDGDTALIGNHRDNVQGNPNRSSAYVFVRNGDAWVQQAALSDGSQGQFAAHAVALNGDTALIGTYQSERGTRGPVLIFSRNGTNWAQQASLSAGDNGAKSGRFGSAVAVSGDTAFVGAASDINSTPAAGAAYVFTRFTGALWHQQARVRSEDGAALDNFGISVAISGNTVVVGCRDDDIEGVDAQGSAYVFVRTGNFWTLQAKLIAPDGRLHDGFGQSVAIDGDTLVIGSNSATGQNYAQGAAYVYARQGSNWRLQKKLVANDGRRLDYLGYSVAIKGNTIVVGAPLDHRLRPSQGSAYVFTRRGLSWSQTAKLLAAEVRENDNFGVSVAVNNQNIAVGASPIHYRVRTHREAIYSFEPRGTGWYQRRRLRALDNAAGFARSIAMDERTLVAGSNEEIVDGRIRGAAYVFSRIGRNWVPQAKLSPISLDYGVLSFGNSVAVDGDRIVVAATSNVVEPFGFFFVFKRLGNTWHQEARLAPPAPLVQQGGATPVAISGQTIIAGAPWEAIGANTNQGASYIYVYLSGTNWIP